MKNFPQVMVESRQQWRQWLQENHRQTESIWLVTFKKSSGKPWLSNNDIVEEALCLGWIDSLPRKLDNARTMLLLSPRKKGSACSALNKRRVERMIALGLMAPPGLEKIEKAKADGSWDFLNDAESLELPNDLKTALENLPNALRHFQAFAPSAQRGILEWIKNARKAETRAKRVAETAQLASLNRQANMPKDRA